MDQEQEESDAANAAVPHSSGSAHPFAASSSSARDPFPSFEAAMALPSEDEAATSRSALDWSIDTLAELKPAPITPRSSSVPTHGQSTDRPTPLTPRAERFFEDEAQYAALRTPISPHHQPQSSQHAPPPSGSPPPPGSFPPLSTPRSTPRLAPAELHRRCRAAIAYCEARVRQRQLKMDQLPVRPAGEAVSPPSPFSPPAKRTRRSTKVSTKASTKVSTCSPVFPTELSPIAAPSSATGHTTTLSTTPEAERTKRSDAEPSWSEEEDEEKENATASTSASWSAVETPPPRSTAIARRQQRFQAAIEAEASSSSKKSPSVSGGGHATTAVPSTLALYGEAKRLGLADPEAQREFVRLLRSRSTRFGAKT